MQYFPHTEISYAIVGNTNIKRIAQKQGMGKKININLSKKQPSFLRMAAGSVNKFISSS
jgi:hypothetical protein